VSLIRYLRESNDVNDSVDLTKISNALLGMKHFDSNPQSDIPISIEDNSEWVIATNPERLVRTYTFKDKKHVMYFVNELYKYQFEINHHCKIVVDNLEVIVETYTHGFDGITIQDKKIKKISDELYSDVNYFIEN
tara:strand:+ start:953 stop:1357 length:405 start_codon:yes stop_codon:yes gene_type:complete